MRPPHVVCCFQEVVQGAEKQCTVQEELVGQWEVYSTRHASPAASAVSPPHVNEDVSAKTPLMFTQFLHHHQVKSSAASHFTQCQDKSIARMTFW